MSVINVENLTRDYGKGKGISLFSTICLKMQNAPATELTSWVAFMTTRIGKQPGDKVLVTISEREL